MTLILAKFWPYLATAFAFVCAFVYGAFSHQKVKTATADKAASEDKAAASAEGEASARADVLIAQKATAAVQASATDRQKIDADAEALAKTPGAAQAALVKEGYTE